MAIHSRAFLLLRRDLVNLQRFPLTGISAFPTNSANLFHWTAKIEGLVGTVWEGGVFQVSLSFTEDFNCRPPQVNFMTIPFHPNVDPVGGSTSLHLLSEDGWSGDDCTVSALLLALQSLLSNPDLDNGCILNPSAAQLLRDTPHTYKQMVLDCVTASLRIDAGLTPYELDSPPPKHSSEASVRPTSKLKKSSKPISFDDYHTLWKGIATSVTDYRNSTFVKLLEKDSKLGTVHCGPEEQMTGLQKRMEEHTVIKYGKPPKSKSTQPTVDLSAKSKLQRIEDLKRMYRKATEVNESESEQQETNPIIPVVSLGLASSESARDGNSGDEIDQLVQWTKNLNEQQLVS